MKSPTEFITLGCRLNSFESEAMRKLTKNCGLSDSIVINTCAVTSEAVKKSSKEVRRQIKKNPNARIIVTGCAAQINPKSFAKIPGVNSVIGNHEKMQPNSWESILKNATKNRKNIHVQDVMTVSESSGNIIDGFSSRSRAYVQIQNGCDHRCTFCIIPFGRGNSRSVPAGVIIDQIQRLVEKGFNEVVLTGVDLTSWGDDLPISGKLGNLVKRILKLVPNLPRLRISSIDCSEVDEELMEVISNESRFMPHLHLSLQHGDDLILKRMKRRHSRKSAIKFCEMVRKHRPDIVFGADLIAGFPTETERNFENSVNLIFECDLTWLHIFPYSPRKGTPAARMPQINRNEIKLRAAELRKIGKKQVYDHLKSQLGKTHQVLMESTLMGRTEQFAEVSFNIPQKRGQISKAVITGKIGTKLTAMGS